MGIFQKSSMGQESRDYVAENCKEGTDPRSDIEDFGEHDEDYNEHYQPEPTDVTASTEEEIQTYYDSLRRTDIRILPRE